MPRAKDLTGKRFGKWVVLGIAEGQTNLSGNREQLRPVWRCRCDCGVQKNLSRADLFYRTYRRFPLGECAHRRVPHTKLYRRWRDRVMHGCLPKEWQDFETFKKAVGNPPNNRAQLGRRDPSKPHGPENTCWVTPARNRLVAERRRKDRREQSVVQSKMLRKIRNAKTKGDRKRYMIEARKAGYAYELIGQAAGLTRQRAYQIVAESVQ